MSALPRFRPHLDHPVGLQDLGAVVHQNDRVAIGHEVASHRSSPRCSTDAGRWTAHPDIEYAGGGRRPGATAFAGAHRWKGRGRALKRQITQTYPSAAWRYFRMPQMPLRHRAHLFRQAARHALHPLHEGFQRHLAGFGSARCLCSFWRTRWPLMSRERTPGQTSSRRNF